MLQNRKLISLILGVMLLMTVFAGCGKDSQAPASATEPAKTETSAKEEAPAEVVESVQPAETQPETPDTHAAKPAGVRSSALAEPLNPLTGPVSVPDVFVDGTYRRVAGEAQLTRPGAVVYAAGTISVWPIDKEAVETVTIDTLGANEPFHYLLESIGVNSSFTVAEGKINAIIVRPPTFGTTERSCPYLTKDFMNGVRVTVACNAKQSPEGGAVTPSDTCIYLSDTLESVILDMRGEDLKAADGNSSAISVDAEGIMTIDSSAAGESAKFYTENEDGGFRSFKVTVVGDGTVSFYYLALDPEL